MYTWGGDANLDGTLNGDDYFQIDSNIGLAGTVFGFREAGIHFAELIWSLAFAIFIQHVMRTRVKNRWVADVAPLLTIGAFYAAARGWDLTQIEYLVAFPLLLSVGAAADAGDGGGQTILHPDMCQEVHSHPAEEKMQKTEHAQRPRERQERVK